MATPPPTAAPPEASAPSRPSFHIRPVPASATYALRHAVLWPDRPPAYVQLADDADGWHFGAFLGPPPTPAGATVGAEEEEKEEVEEEPISVLSLFLDDSLHHHPTDKTDTENTTYYRFRKFATAVPWQGRGAGSALLRHVMGVAAARQPEQQLDHDGVGVGVGGGDEDEEQEDGGKRRRRLNNNKKNGPDGDDGGVVIWCDARQSALPFYARFGFAAAGDVFYKGDVPYLQMSRRLV